ncbi:MAG TPA: rhamnulokinase family protein [Gaiellaceae bacterium]|nr:rhamnulokinase family protein [Gaiellaceae bacterium]
MAAAAFVCAAVDLGAESGRVCAGSFDGARVELTEVHRFANTPVEVDGTVCWDLPRLLAGVRDGLAAARARLGRVDSVSVDTWAVDAGLLDAAGRLLSPVRHYRSATRAQMERVLERLPARELYGLTGIQLLPINTVFQLAGRREELERAARVLLVPDLVNHDLTGLAATEETIASTTQLVDAGGRDWSARVFDALELPRAPFPEIAACGTVLGPLGGEAAAAAGLSRATVVVQGPSHDTAAAVAGVPAADGSAAFLASGTWSLVGLELDAPLVTDESFAANVTNERGICGTVRALKNVTGLWLVQECRRAWSAQGSSLGWDELVELAGRTAPGPLFDPDEPGLLRPGADMPERIAAATGGRVDPGDQAAVARAIFDSLAHAYRAALERVEAAAGRRAEVVHVVGGGARNRLLCRLTAEALGRPVLAGPVEASSLGNVLGQLLAHGLLGTRDELRAVARASAEVERYEPAAASARHDEFLAAGARA